MAVIYQDVSQVLSFGQAGDTAEDVALTYQYLAFSEGAAGRALHAYVTDTLDFRQAPRVTGDQRRSTTQALAFTQAASRVRVGYAYQNFVIVQSAGGGRGHAASQTLTFTQTASGSAPHWALDTLAFTQTASAGFARARGASQALAFDQGAAAYFERASRVAVVLPAPAPALTVTLSTPAGTVTLPAPDFGNSETLGQTRVQRNARGGTLVVFRPPYWPTTDEFAVTFSYLSGPKAAELRRAVAGSVGRLCTYTDHESKAWQVVVTNPDMVVTQVGPANYVATLKLLVAV